MKNTMKLLAVAALVLLVAPIPAQAQADYDYQVIEHPGADFVQMFGINDRGDAVGNASAAGSTIPFVYRTKKGTFMDVPPVAGYDSTSILGISDSGVLVGSVRNLSTGVDSGVIIDKKGKATVFDHPDAATFTQARGVNNRGLVTGFRDSASGEVSGFIYDPKKGSFIDIVPSFFTIAQGINSRGDVVGSAIFDSTTSPCPGNGPYNRFGWLRTADGNVTFFDVNGGITRARGITDSGTIAGFVTDTTTLLTEGFVVQLDGSQCQSVAVAGDDLLMFPGSNNTIVEDIENSGAVVGQADDASGVSQGFVAWKN